MPNILATVADYDDAIKGTCVIDFTATWCGPCRFIAPKFEALSKNEKYSGINFCKLDVDDNSDASEKAGITCMPTFHFYKDGAKVDELQGASEAKIVEKLDALL